MNLAELVKQEGGLEQAARALALGTTLVSGDDYSEFPAYFRDLVSFTQSRLIFELVYVTLQINPPSRQDLLQMIQRPSTL